MPTTKKVIKVNKAQCHNCKDIIESKHVHDFVQCKCGAIFVDGGKEYLRRGGDMAEIIELSVEETVPMTPFISTEMKVSLEEAPSIDKVLNEAIHKNDRKGVKYYIQERGTCGDHYGTMVFSLESQEKGIQNKLGMMFYKTLIENGEVTYNRSDAEVRVELVDSSRIDMW